jgi:hypothetical protein
VAVGSNRREPNRESAWLGACVMGKSFIRGYKSTKGRMLSMKLARLCGSLLFVSGFASVLHAIAAVPELDPGSVVSAGMLLGGVLLVVRSRRR